MNNFLYILIFVLIFSSSTFGQCGNIPSSGKFFDFRPLSENIPCLSRGEVFNSYQLFDYTPDVINLGVNSLIITIDSIGGLPNGIDFNIHKIIDNNATSYYDICINFYGSTNVSQGKYPLYYYGYIYNEGGIDIDTTTEIISFLNYYIKQYPDDTIRRPFLEVVEDEADCNHKLTTGISNYRDEIKLEVYPNPASDHVFFKSDQRLRVEISNLKGQIVIQPSQSFNNMVQLDLATFPKGIYFYKAESENGKTAFGKVIVTH